MATDADPVVGNWYELLDKSQRFEVVKVDEDKGVVEIQYFDGDLDEMELDEWYGLNIEPIEAPEDWTGAIDNIEQDDLGYTETEMAGEEEDERGEGYPGEEPWEEKE